MVPCLGGVSERSSVTPQLPFHHERPTPRHTNCLATYLLGHVMSGSAVHVVVAPLEEVVLDDLQVLAGVRKLELILGLA